MRPPAMSRRALLRLIDAPRVEAAIRQAERRTSGEICVSVSRFFWGDVHRVAERAAERLGLKATRDRNGVLFFLVPSRRRFVVLGDVGIHAVVAPGFWVRVAAAVETRLRAGDFTGGLVDGIEAVGEQLAVHFPFDPATDTNELSDELDRGGA